MTYHQACQLVRHFRLWADRVGVDPRTCTTETFGTLAEHYCAVRSLPLGALIEALRLVRQPQAGREGPAITEGAMESTKETARGHSMQRRALYGSRRWRIARGRYLKAHPWCLHCGRPATVVDHVQGHSGDWLRRFWDERQWQPLCAACHGRKTILVDATIDGAQRRRYRSGFTPPQAPGRGPGGAECKKTEGAAPTSGPRWIFIPGPDSADSKRLPPDSAEFLAHQLRARTRSHTGAGS